MKWIPVSERTPKIGEYVLAAGPSGYLPIKWHYETAHYNPEYRPLNPWLDVANDAMTDGWPEITHWMPLPEPPCSWE